MPLSLMSSDLIVSSLMSVDESGHGRQHTPPLSTMAATAAGFFLICMKMQSLPI